jgi:hypothetical protein
MNGALPVPFILIYYGKHQKCSNAKFQTLMVLLSGLGHVESGPLVTLTRPS